MSTPVRMRVYPMTRFTEQMNQPILESRVELLDGMGDSVKGTGWFRVELFARDRAGDAAIGRRLYSWEVPLLTLADQQRYYDPITRAYLFRLKLDEHFYDPRGAILQALFSPVTGARLEAEADLFAGSDQAVIGGAR